MDQDRRHPKWRNAGSCRGSDPNLFYPIGRSNMALEQAQQAKTLCRSCPSQPACLGFALSTRQEIGVWGGTLPEERRAIWRAARRERVAS